MVHDTAVAPGADGAATEVSDDSLAAAVPARGHARRPVEDDPSPPARARVRPDRATPRSAPGWSSAAQARQLRPTTEPLRQPESLTRRMRVIRAVFLVLLTLIAPGAAQLAAGNRRIGRVALRVWLGAGSAVVLTALLWLLDRNVVLRLATSSLLLALLAVALFAAAVVWPLLVLDAWRLGRPLLLPQRARLAMTGLLVVALVVTTVPVVGAARRLWAASSLLEGVFGGGAASAAVKGRYNVLLMGGDAGPDRVGTRPDSLTLASIDDTTGRTVLFSLPRNLENVRFPEGSSGAAALPDGWTCGDECLLNGLYTWGSEHPETFPGARDPGAEAMKQAVEGITGLTVNYYVLVDLLGFRNLIDALGGIELTVGERVPIGGGTSRVSGYIEPGTQRLNGYYALWYARSRHGASDYARMARQRCVMDAMVRQLDPTTLLAKFQGIAAAAQDVVSTDLPAGELATFIDLGTKGKSHKISSVAFVPPLVEPAYPDYELIQERVIQALITSREQVTVTPSPSAPALSAAGAAESTAGPGTVGATGAATAPGAASSAAVSPSRASSPTPSTSAEAAAAPPVDVGAACSPA